LGWRWGLIDFLNTSIGADLRHKMLWKSRRCWCFDCFLWAGGALVGYCSIELETRMKMFQTSLRYLFLLMSTVASAQPQPELMHHNGVRVAKIKGHPVQVHTGKTTLAQPLFREELLTSLIDFFGTAGGEYIVIPPRMDNKS
jgi:hypothetical protein